MSLRVASPALRYTSKKNIFFDFGVTNRDDRDTLGGQRAAPLGALANGDHPFHHEVTNVPVHASTQLFDAHHASLPLSRNISAEEAMVQFQRGDEAAYGRVYALCARRIYGQLCRLSRDPALAEDLTQETFVRMARARDAYDPTQRLLPWAHTIARRLYVDHLRRVRHERSAGSLLAAAGEGAAAPSVDEHLDAAYVAAAVKAALARLPPKQAEAFQLMRAEGLSANDASARLGDTPLSLRLRVHRATVAIRRELASAFDRDNELEHLPSTRAHETSSRTPRNGHGSSDARHHAVRAHEASA